MITKKNITGIVGAGIAALTLATCTGTLVTSAKADPINPGGPMQQHRERHPEIRHALGALNRAKTFLQNGSHDFSGHREKALDLTQQAIAECQQALQEDRH